MLHVHDGQCGLCAHFGEHSGDKPKLVQIRTSKSAPVDLVAECGHPKNQGVHLKVTPISSCAGYTPAKLN